MLKVKPYTFWFVTGRQHLYGEEALTQVKKHSEDMVRQMNATGKLANEIVFKDVLTNAEDIVQLMHAANADEYCAGVITWMHTFSPAKIWIAGLKSLQKPFLHFHTQYNEQIPRSEEHTSELQSRFDIVC